MRDWRSLPAVDAGAPSSPIAAQPPGMLRLAARRAAAVSLRARALAPRHALSRAVALRDNGSSSSNNNNSNNNSDDGSSNRVAIGKLSQPPAYLLSFTCKKCDTRMTRNVSKQAYHHGEDAAREGRAAAKEGAPKRRKALQFLLFCLFPLLAPLALSSAPVSTAPTPGLTGREIALGLR